MDVTIFGIDLELNPIAFNLFGVWTVYWYGIIIALGFSAAVVYAFFNAKRFNVNIDKLIDAVLVSTPVAILSARLYYMLFYYNGEFTFKDFFGIGSDKGFSGLAIYGGVIGAAVAGLIMCKVCKLKVLDVFDLASIGFLIGQGIGRWGNFINQEAFGTLTGSNFWGMESGNTIAECGFGMVHPCFLYESVWCIIGVVLLHIISKKRKYSGQISLCYCAWYGFGRAVIEGLRTDSLKLGSIRVSQVLSAVICVASIVVMYVIYRKNKSLTSQKEVYVPMFADTEENSNADDTETENSDTEETENV